MNEILKKIIYSCFAVYFIISIIGGAILSYRLERSRQQLNTIRMELAAASDKQQRIAEIVRGTGEILSETFITVAGIRSQIAAIRESYEEMEKLLYSSNSNNISDNDTNLQKTKVGDYNEQ